MRQRLGSDLPTFSEKDKEFIRNKIDFVGLNHYTSRLIAHHQNPDDAYFYQVQQIERIGMVLQLPRKDKKMYYLDTRSVQECFFSHEVGTGREEEGHLVKP
jgi:beta-glucosidase/6-phospho-beta-glucosidase/beta-galactosidase